MAVLAGEVQGREAGVIYAVHETEGAQQNLDNVVVTIPCRLVESCVAILTTAIKKTSKINIKIIAVAAVKKNIFAIEDASLR